MTTTFQPVCCPCCRAEDKQAVASGIPDWTRPDSPARFEFSRCRSCGAGYLDPRPQTPEELYEEHPKHLARGRKHGVLRTFFRRLLYRLFLHYPPALPGWRGHLLRSLLKGRWRAYSENHPEMLVPWRGQGRLLDVGCAAGDKTVKYANLGWAVTGVELTERAAQSASARHGLDVRVGLLEAQRFPSESFDAALLIFVLEHVPDPRALLLEIRRILAPGGVLLIDVPNFDSRLREVFGPFWTQYSAPRHLWIPTEPAVRTLLEQTGFRVEYVRYRCSMGLYLKSLERARRHGAVSPKQPQDEAAILQWFRDECAAPRGELMAILASI